MKMKQNKTIANDSLVISISNNFRYRKLISNENFLVLLTIALIIRYRYHKRTFDIDRFAATNWTTGELYEFILETPSIAVLEGFVREMCENYSKAISLSKFVVKRVIVITMLNIHTCLCMYLCIFLTDMF